MDRAALQRRLQEAEDLMQGVEENIVFQRRMIATLEQGGHDAKAATRFLKRLEALRAKHVTSRDQLFKQLANGF